MKIYVGTYKAYNNGSLRGAWVDLDSLSSYDELLKTCRKIHCFERDPEYMVQDTETDGEDWQAGFTGELLSAYEDYWKIKAEFAKPKKAVKRVRASVCDSLEAAAKKSLEEYRAWLEADQQRVARLWKRDVNGHIRGLVGAVRLDDGGWVIFDRPQIKTEFCCGEDDRGQGGDGYGTMAYAHRQCDAFKTESGFKIENNVKSIYNSGRSLERYGCEGYYKRESWQIVKLDEHDREHLENRNGYYFGKQDICREVSEREWRAIRSMEAWRAISMRRRVNAYWKRFGASKLRTWTYWTEA